MQQIRREVSHDGVGKRCDVTFRVLLLTAHDLISV